MQIKNYGHVSAVIFGIIAVLHGARLILGWEAVIGGWMVPMWLSVLAVVLAGSLAWWGCKEGCKVSGPMQ